ncbi:dTDP-4-dehydrorhamnose reductase [candidate division KSB3 bacterium]|uniref:dTDP-4-dehydrorhamnose reductase n=1 Tax=candidate division KSB3 bacterium TaxID=2044937 RepID=A0A9D5K023_9BACT|nr:dTDP-4-dehydrorhamnose reductase [candidate division KSB3 bacterium]MBD3327383.1 dTDP-4-dehydrorhamnose reductase [candidate division KSB3 bacterium]
MKVIVTGARGMVGTDLLHILDEQHIETLACDLPQCDILNADQFEEMVALFQPDTIIHTAAYTNVDQAESDREAARELNEIGTMHVATIAKTYQAKLVSLSTDYVFDGTQTRPYTEDDPPHPVGVYGETKRRGEEQIQRILGDQEYLIVRTAWLYGRHGKNFVETIRQLALQQRTLRVVDDQTGSPTYTRDLARGILALLQQNGSGIVHVTNSGVCTWYEFAKTILDYTGITDVTVQPISSADLQRPAPRPGFSVLDTSKFTALTGQTIRHWKHALHAYLQETMTHEA